MKGSEREREREREKRAHHDDYDAVQPIVRTSLLAHMNMCVPYIRVCVLYIDTTLETCPISVYVPLVRRVGNWPLSGPVSSRCKTSEFS